METLFTLENGAAFAALALLEIVLGIDNIVLLAVLSSTLPKHQQSKARKIGLILAMLMRLMLLGVIGWVMGLTKPLFDLFGHEITGKSIVLIIGGGFLLYKAVKHIHEELETNKKHETEAKAKSTFLGVIAQIVAMDAVFSLDSVITAVGMVETGPDNPHGIWVMVAAVVLAVLVMLIFADAIANFIDRHPTTKMLALSFMLLIGVVLVADGFGQHIQRGYIYSAMAFSLFVELLNLKRKSNTKKPAAKEH